MKTHTIRTLLFTVAASAMILPFISADASANDGILINLQPVGQSLDTGLDSFSAVNVLLNQERPQDPKGKQDPEAKPAPKCCEFTGLHIEWGARSVTGLGIGAQSSILYWKVLSVMNVVERVKLTSGKSCDEHYKDKLKKFGSSGYLEQHSGSRARYHEYLNGAVREIDCPVPPATLNSNGSSAIHKDDYPKYEIPTGQQQEPGARKKRRPPSGGGALIK